MKQFFETVFLWFQNFYGTDLARYLVGDYDLEGGVAPNSHCLSFGLVTLLVPLLVALIFYLVINHPKWNRFFPWLISLVASALVTGGVTYAMLLHGHYIPGKMVEYEPQDGEWVPVDLAIGLDNLMLFAVVTAILSLVVYFIWSLILKSLSRNCSHTPF